MHLFPTTTITVSLAVLGLVMLLAAGATAQGGGGGSGQQATNGNNDSGAAAAAKMAAQYHRMADSIDYFRSVEGTCPFVTVEETFDTAEVTKSLISLRVTGRRTVDRNKIVIMMVAGAHGRELFTSEFVRSFIDLVCDVENDIPGLPIIAPSTLQEILDNVEFVIVPFANPYSRAVAEDSDVCFHVNEKGVDIDLNWELSWGKGEGAKDPQSPFYAGTSAFSEAEPRILRAIALTNKVTSFISIRSGDLSLYMPWDHSPELPVEERGGPSHHLITDLHLHHCAECRLGAAGRELGFLRHGTAADYFFGKGTPTVLTASLYRGSDTARDNLDCFAFFNPAEVDEFNSYLARWVSFPLTAARFFIRLEEGQKTKAGPQLAVDDMAAVFNKQVLPALATLDIDSDLLFEWADASDNGDSNGGITAVAHRLRVPDAGVEFEYVRIEERASSSGEAAAPALGVLLLGFERPNDVYSQVVISELLTQIREGTVDYATTYGGLTLYVVPAMPPGMRHVVHLGKLCESHLEVEDVDILQVSYAMRSQFLRDLVERENIGVVVTIVNEGDYEVSLKGSGPVRRAGLADDELKSAQGYFSAEALSEFTEALTKSLRNRELSLSHQHTTASLGPVTLITKLSLYEAPANINDEGHCDYFLVNPPQFSNPEGVNILSSFLQTLGRFVKQNPDLARAIPGALVLKRGMVARAAMSLLRTTLWVVVPAAILYGMYWYKYVRNARPRWRPSRGMID